MLEEDRGYEKATGKVRGLTSELRKETFFRNVFYVYLTYFWLDDLPLFYEVVEDKSIPLDLHEGDEVEVWYQTSENLFQRMAHFANACKEGEDAYKILAIYHNSTQTFTKLSQGRPTLPKKFISLLLLFLTAVVLAYYSGELLVLLFGLLPLLFLMFLSLLNTFIAYRQEQAFEEDFAELVQEYEEDNFYIDVDE